MVKPLGTTEVTFDERDQIRLVSVTDTDAKGNTVFRNTLFNYYNDGSKRQVIVTDGTNTIGSQDFLYDLRGRLTSNTDHNGTSADRAPGSPPSPVTTTFSYANDGTVTESLSNGKYTKHPHPHGGRTHRSSARHSRHWLQRMQNQLPGNRHSLPATANHDLRRQRQPDHLE
ncbi:MAG: hypothetical protein HC933_04975 [Pleurocapsa sp. SU_196_0]|nr:hypothetical protein [Pleurocapsa sp. SU_196_0]